MRFFFSEEDHSTEVRAREIRAALIHAHHRVTHGHSRQPAPSTADVWMYGLGVAGSPPIRSEQVQQLCRSTARIVLFQLCDASTLSFEQVPPEVAARTCRFLRNHWPAAPESVPAEFRARLGFLPPMIKPMSPRPGRELKYRERKAVFYGTRTGLTNLTEGRNAREECVRLMRDSGLPFQGGIVPHQDPRYQANTRLIVPQISGRLHAKLLSDSVICLAPWGNHPITYRLFEGLARRCLVFAQSLGETRFIDGGLRAGRDYVEIAPDLSNLVEMVDYYLAHLDKAQKIADAGHRHFARHFAARGRLISQFLFDQAVQSWGSLYEPETTPSLISRCRSLRARLFAKRA